MLDHVLRRGSAFCGFLLVGTTALIIAPLGRRIASRRDEHRSWVIIGRMLIAYKKSMQVLLPSLR